MAALGLKATRETETGSRVSFGDPVMGRVPLAELPPGIAGLFMGGQGLFDSALVFLDHGQAVEGIKQLEGETRRIGFLDGPGPE